MPLTPVIAIVGRPNVGKSTLFNRLTKTRKALVSDIAELTRDRQYGTFQYQEKNFIIIDTGGFTTTNEFIKPKATTKKSIVTSSIKTLIAKQSWLAINEAQIVLFVVDAKSGLSPLDIEIAQKIRKMNKQILLVINKIDGIKTQHIANDFYNLGLGEPYLISAAHGDGIKHLLNNLANKLAFSQSEEEETEKNIKIKTITITEKESLKVAFIGRPNVGKSTLINRILGEERVVVSEQAGTTRDSIYVDFTRRNKNYTLIDTAGIRRRGKVSDKIEKFSIVKALQAIETANVVVLVLDARENITEQDLHLLGFILENGKALIIAVNKWDNLPKEQRIKMQHELDRRLSFVDFAPIHFISALHGTGVGDLFPSIDKAYASAIKKIKTPDITKILIDAVNEFPPPLARGRRIKLRYAHVGGHNPLVIVIHGNQTKDVPKSYEKYLERTFRKKLRLFGTPVRIEFKTVYNPYVKKHQKKPNK